MPPLRQIGAKEVQDRLQRGETAAIIDVREPEEYRALHAAGALSLPLAEVSAEAVTARLSASNHPPNVALHFICHSGRRATEACERVLDEFPAATIIEGGTLAWAQAGLPVHSGDKP